MSQSLPKMVKMVGLDLLIFETFVVLVISDLVPQREKTRALFFTNNLMF